MRDHRSLRGGQNTSLGGPVASGRDTAGPVRGRAAIVYHRAFSSLERDVQSGGTSRSSPSRAVLFDLDDTLVVEVASADAAFLAACRLAQARCGLDPVVLAQAVRRHAGELWRAGPHVTYCRAIGISSWEGLWASFAGDETPLPALRVWAAGYRVQAWVRARDQCGVQQDSLADELAATFQRERRGRHVLYPDVVPTLAALRDRRCRLAVVTNGVGDLQLEKLAGAGLTDQFDVVVVSAELGASPGEVIMVGDSLARDVLGAQRVGSTGIWLNRAGEAPSLDIMPDGVITTLGDLPAIVDSAECWARR